MTKAKLYITIFPVMNMLAQWNNLVITRIAAAVRVSSDKYRPVHTGRPFHGLVINDDFAGDYRFADGTVLCTQPGAVYYLPKGSSYTVASTARGVCYAINFDENDSLQDTPFVLYPQQTDVLLRHFRQAVQSWKQAAPEAHTAAMSHLYAIVSCLLAEANTNYISGGQKQLLAPALEKLQKEFTDPRLTVTALAQLCGITPAYFRKLFERKFRISPKQYLTQLRLGYAKKLLQSGEFSVSETARLCGYAEPCHFTREFSQHMGISPGKFRREQT